MKQRFTYMIVALLGLAVLGVGPVLGQERDREERRRERQLEAAEEALRALQDAISQLRESRSEAAGEQLEDAMRALREARGELRGSGFSMLAPDVNVLEDGLRGFTFLASRPRMGVEVTSGSDVAADAAGAEILRVTPESPADEAGLEAGDVITAVNGESLARTGQRGREPGSKLIEVIRELEEGDTVQVRYLRNGESRTASVVLRELDNAFSYSFIAPGGGSNWSVRVPDVEVIAPEIAGRHRILSRLYEFGWLNMELVTLNEELGTYFGTTEGLLVLKSPEDDALDLRSGDVILSIDGRKPTSPSHAMRILRSYDEGEAFDIDIMRQQRRVTVTGVVPDRDEDVFFRERRERRER